MEGDDDTRTARGAGRRGGAGERPAAGAGPQPPVGESDGGQDHEALAAMVNATRQAQAARHDIENRFAALVRNLQDHAIFSLDLEGRVTTWNVAAEQVLGYSQEEALGRPFWFIFTDEDRRQGAPEAELRTAREQGRAADERWHLRKGGQPFWASGVLSALHDTEGRHTGFAKILRDMTERKRAEQALRASEARYRLLFENMIEGFVLAEMIWDAHGDPLDWRYLEVNPAWSQTGIAAHAALGRTAREVDPAIERYWIDTYARVVRTGEPARYENFAAGLGKWFETFAFRHSENRFGLVLRDVTGRVRAQQALLASQAGLQKAVSAPTVGVLSFDLDGRIRDANAAFERMSGYHSDELRGLAHWSVLTAPEFRELTMRNAAVLATHGDPAPYEKQMIRKDGARWWGLFAPTRVSDGVTSGECMEFVVDVTDRRLAEEALRESVRRKDEFLAMLSHELRNPLAPIRNAVRLLRALPSGNPALDGARDVIDRQVAHLVRLVDDLLDVSRVSRGKIRLRTETVVLATVVRQALEISRPLIEARRHALAVSVPDEPLSVEGDVVRLVQVVCNLLNNAAKYTDEGGRIAVSIERTHDDGRPGVLIRVADSGRGIDPAVLPHVFDLFYQADRNLDRTEGGLGIGLSLARSIVDLHGGGIEAASAGRGKGSEFVVRLPLVLPAGPAAAPAQPAAAPGARGLRVLVVDDNRDAADSLALLLQTQDHMVLTAYDGVQACALALAERPQVVLLDIGLPGLNGYEACRAMREAGLADVFIVALTGYGQAADRRHAEESGFDAHLVKPVDFEVLGGLLERVARAGAGRR